MVRRKVVDNQMETSVIDERGLEGRGFESRH